MYAAAVSACSRGIRGDEPSPGRSARPPPLATPLPRPAPTALTIRATVFMPPDYAAYYAAAVPLAEYIAGAEKNKAFWEAVYRGARVGEEAAARAAALPAPLHLLVISEDWCGDAVNSVPVLARLAELAPARLDLRVLARDAHPALMDAHLTDGSRSIPIVIALDGAFAPLGAWGPRPRELQQWVRGPGQALDKEARYKEVRRWYARDRGRAVVSEVLDVLERAPR